MTELISLATDFFRNAAQCPEGQRMLRGNVEDVHLVCQFDPKDDEPFFVEILKGNLMVKEGRWPSIAYDYPRIRAYKKDLLEVFKGKTRPYTAKMAGKWEISWRDRRGGIFTVLVRIGQDVVRDRIIQNS